MNRTGLVIALAVAATVGLVFGLWPDLDLRLAAPFFDFLGIGGCAIRQLFNRVHEAQKPLKGGMVRPDGLF